MSLHSSLEGTKTERETVQFGYSELAGSPFVSAKIHDLGNYLQHSKFYTSTDLDFVNLAGNDTVLVTPAQ